jgi:hypothetical protein
MLGTAHERTQHILKGCRRLPALGGDEVMLRLWQQAIQAGKLWADHQGFLIIKVWRQLFVV